MTDPRRTAIVFGLLLALGPAPSRAADPALELASSDPRLARSFEWAKGQALAYACDGDPVGPWYEAALPGREAFCMRDVAHQASGAHALGLSRRTHNMLWRFADAMAELRHLPVRTNLVSVRLDGARKSTLTNERGPSFLWQATFEGASDTLLVNGQPMKATVERAPLGRTTSWTQVVVGAGGRVTVARPEG